MRRTIIQLAIILLAFVLSGCESLLTNDDSQISQYDLSSFHPQARVDNVSNKVLEIRIKPMGAGLATNRIFTINQNFEIEPIANVRWAAPLNELVGFHLSRSFSESKQFGFVTTRPGDLVSDYVLVIELQEFYLGLKPNSQNEVSIKLQGYFINKTQQISLNGFTISKQKIINETSITETLKTLRELFEQVQSELIDKIDKVNNP